MHTPACVPSMAHAVKGECPHVHLVQLYAAANGSGRQEEQAWARPTALPTDNAPQAL